MKPRQDTADLRWGVVFYSRADTRAGAVYFDRYGVYGSVNTLAYTPTDTDREEKYHSIEVRVKREGLTILTRQGYYSGGIPR